MSNQALKIIGRLYDFEREVQAGDANERHRIRQRKSRRVAGVLHRWLLAKRREVPDGSATARAIDCVFRLIVTARSGIVTADFGIVTGRSGIVTDTAWRGIRGCV